MGSPYIANVSNIELSMHIVVAPFTHMTVEMKMKRRENREKGKKNVLNKNRGAVKYQMSYSLILLSEKVYSCICVCVCESQNLVGVLCREWERKRESKSESDYAVLKTNVRFLYTIQVWEKKLVVLWVEIKISTDQKRKTSLAETVAVCRTTLVWNKSISWCLCHFVTSFIFSLVFFFKIKFLRWNFLLC